MQCFGKPVFVAQAGRLFRVLSTTVSPGGQTSGLTKYSHESQARHINTEANTGTSRQNSRVSQMNEEEEAINFRFTIQNFTNPDSLLTFSQQNDLPMEKVNIILRRLSQLVEKQNIPEILEDQQFQKLGNRIHQEVPELPVPTLLNSLNALLSLSPDDIYLIKSLETQVIWLLKKMSVSQLVHTVQVHKEHQETDLRKQIYQDALSAAQKRWIEIATGRDMLTLMYLASENGDTDFFAKLEERALDICDTMNTAQLQKIISLLSKHKRRNTPLLRSAAYHINKQGTDKLTMGQISNLLYACATLNFCDEDLMINVTQSILDEVSSTDSQAILSSIYRSLGALRWCHKELLDSLANQLVKTFDASSLSDLHALLLTAASVNHCPPAILDSFNIIKQKLTNQSPKDWLECIWAAVVLQQADSQTIESVLTKEFIQSLKGADDSLPVSQQLKLLNIDAAAKYEVPDYSGPLLEAEFITDSLQVPSRSPRSLHSLVMKALSNMGSLDRYAHLDVATPAGHVVDFEIIVNGQGQLQPVTEYHPLFSWQTGGTKAVPEDFHRVALKVLDFTDMTRNTVQPGGLSSLALRQLGKLGYTVIQVPYTEFGPLKNVVQRVQYLQGKINSAVGIKKEG